MHRRTFQLKPGLVVVMVTITVTGLALAWSAGVRAAGEPAAPPPKDPRPLSGDQRSAAAAKYESLFGAEDKSVTATASGKDDARLAVKLIQAVKSLGDDPPMVAVVCERAYALGLKDPDGYAAALEGLRLWAGVDPDAGKQARSRLIELHRLRAKNGRPADRLESSRVLAAELATDADRLTQAHQYVDALKLYKEALSAAQAARSVRADEINVKIKTVANRQRALEKVEKLRRKLDAAPSDAAVAAEIISTCVTELDDPAMAAKLAAGGAAAGADAKTRRMVPLAAKDPADLPTGDLLALAAWYRSLADEASLAGKAVVLKRAHEYYTRFLDAHEKQDADRLTATRQLADVVKQLDSLTPGLLKADRIVIWNQYNLDGSRGTGAVNVVLALRGEVVWRRDNIKVPWENKRDTFVAVPVPAVAFDRVRVEVTQWHGVGGGLSEVQVLRGPTNIAAGSPVTASAVFRADFPPTHLTDGNVSSAKQGSYWLLPNSTAGWAEIDLRAPRRHPAKR